MHDNHDLILGNILHEYLDFNVMNFLKKF